MRYKKHLKTRVKGYKRRLKLQKKKSKKYNKYRVSRGGIRL